MLDEMKKISRRSVIWRLLLAIVLIIALLFISKNSIQKMIEGPKNIDSLSMKELPKSYVNANIKMIYSNFAEYYQKDDDGTETVTDHYYIIPVGEEEFIGLVVNADDYDKAQKLYEESYEYFEGKRELKDITTTLKVTGTVNKMSDEAYDYYHDWFETSGYLDNPTEKEIRKIALPYVLQIDYIGSFDSVFVYIFIFLIAVLALCVLIMVIMSLSGMYLSDIKKLLKKNEFVNQERLESDYRSGTQIGSVRICNNYFYYLHNSKIKVIPNTDIVWAYLQNVTHRTYGIKIWVNKSLIIYTKDKKRHIISMRKEEQVNAVLNLISEKQQNAVIGYSDKLKKLYKKDRNAFLNYNSANYYENTNSSEQG